VAPEVIECLSLELDKFIRQNFWNADGVILSKATRSHHLPIALAGTTTAVETTGAGRVARAKTKSVQGAGATPQPNPAGATPRQPNPAGGTPRQPNPAGGTPCQPNPADTPSRPRKYIESALADDREINASLKNRRNAKIIKVSGDGNCFLHAVISTAPELFHDISGHIRLREVLVNFLRNNNKTVIYNDEHGGAKFEDLFVYGEGGCKSYNAYIKVLRKPNVYADVMLVYALIYKFQVNVEIVDTLTGESPAKLITMLMYYYIMQFVCFRGIRVLIV
jgi:hypothetical protein